MAPKRQILLALQNSCLFTFLTAVCLHFDSRLFTYFSCLFTFLAAVFLHISATLDAI